MLIILNVIRQERVFTSCRIPNNMGFTSLGNTAPSLWIHFHRVTFNFIYFTWDYSG